MKNNILLGLFVTIGTVLFIAAIYYIGNRQHLFGGRFYISAVFNDVKGLQPGNNVRYAGIDIGTVHEVILLNDSAVQVDMMLNEDVRSFIRKDAVARIGSDGLVGNIIVSIKPGPGKESTVKSEDFIRSTHGMETDELLNDFGHTNQQIQSIAQNMIVMTERINEGAGTIGMLLSDSLLAMDLRRSINNLRAATQMTSDISSSLNNLMKEVEKGEGLVGSLLTDTIIMDHLRASTGQLDTLFDTQLEPILTELRTTSENLSAFSSDLEQLSEQVEKGKGPVGALLHDSLMQRDLQETLNNLNEGTARFNENMEALKHNFLFRRYFRKQEKQRKKEN